MNKKLRENAHELAKSLYQIKVIDSITLKNFDRLCVSPVPNLNAEQIKKIRLKQKVSQSVFALCLNTTLSTIKQWEIGKKHPRGTSLKLLNLVLKNGLETII